MIRICFFPPLEDGIPREGEILIFIGPELQTRWLKIEPGKKIRRAITHESKKE
jgi:hypothetical protein